MSVPEWLAKYEDQQLATVALRLPKEDVLKLLETSPETVTVVDIRNDREKGFITKAVHIPAPTVEGPAEIGAKFIEPILEKAPDTKLIVVHCNSSARRASYIGGWADDYLKGKDVDVAILDEGIVGWLKGGDEFAGETTIVQE